MDAKQHFERAITEFSRGNYPAAIELFQKVTHQTDPEGFYVDLAVGFVSQSYKMAAIRLIAEGQLKGAQQLIGDALQAFAGDPELEFYRGVAANNANQYLAAVRLFEGLQGREPALGSVMACFGVALLNMGNFQKAEEMLQKALKPGPEIVHLLAICKYRGKNLAEAADLLQRSVAQKTPFVEAQCKLIGAYIALRRYDEALKLLAQTAGSIDRGFLVPPYAFLKTKVFDFPESPALREIMELAEDAPTGEADIRKWTDAMFYEAISINVMDIPFQGKRGELIRQDWFRGMLVNHYQKMITQGMDLLELYFRLGREFQRINQPVKAQEYFQKCLERNSRFLPAKISLGFAYKEEGRVDDAVHVFEEIQHDFNNIPNMVLHAGESTFDEDGYRGKEEHLRAELKLLLTAADQGGQFADLYYSIGRIYYLLEDPEQALSFFDKASLINPNFIRANMGKAVTLMQLNRTDQAREILNGMSTGSNLYAKILYNLLLLYREKGDTVRSAKVRNELLPMDNEFARMARELP